jgi:hypothetical protein
VGDLPLVWLPHVNQHQVRALLIHLLPQLFRGNLRAGVRGLRSDSTEDLVIDQLVN